MPIRVRIRVRIRGLRSRHSASSSSSHSAMSQLNEDILRYIVSYLSPEALKKASAANRVFYEAWMKFRYGNLTLTNSDKRLLHRLGDSAVAKYVKRAVIRPWFIDPPEVTSTRLHRWTNFNEMIDPGRVTERRLQKCLQEDIGLILRALNSLENIKEYCIEWNEESHYHPEFYAACLRPISQTWTRQLSKLSIKVPPQFLKSLAPVRLEKLETLEYHFCTGQTSPQIIDEMHHGFLVFVNNLKDSLECMSFVSTHTSQSLDITRIYKALGPFPKLRSISLSAPFDGSHLSDPLVFVQFLEKHRSTLKEISILTTRCTVHSRPTNPESIDWIQKILTSIESPFPRLRRLALSMRPLRAPLINISNFLEMHMSTLDSLTLADRTLDYREFERLLKTSSGPFKLEVLRHLRVKLNTFCPTTLLCIAIRMPGLTSLDIDCYSTTSCRSDCAYDTDFDAICTAITDHKEILANWNLQRMSIAQDWARYIERTLVECMPNLRIADWQWH